MRLFVNVIPLSVPSLFARDNKLYNSKRLNFRRLEGCRNRVAIALIIFHILRCFFPSVPPNFIIYFITHFIKS